MLNLEASGWGYAVLPVGPELQARESAGDFAQGSHRVAWGDNMALAQATLVLCPRDPGDPCRSSCDPCWWVSAQVTRGQWGGGGSPGLSGTNFSVCSQKTSVTVPQENPFLNLTPPKGCRGAWWCAVHPAVTRAVLRLQGGCARGYRAEHLGDKWC